MTSSASGDKCRRFVVAGADETGASTSSSCALPGAASAICATKNIAHHARGAQSPPHSQVAQGDDGDDDDDRCSCSGAQNDASQGEQPRPVHSELDSHKVARRREFTSASEVDANLCTDASSISDSSRQGEEDTLRRCENLERWNEEEQEGGGEDADSENVVELESPTGAGDDDEMGAHLSGREAASEGEEQQRQQSGHSQSAPRVSRAQRSLTKQPAGTPTVFDEGRTGCTSQQPMASRDKRPRRARTAHAAASNSAAAAAGASAIAPAIAPTTMNQNRTQSSTPTSATNFRDSNNIINNNQLFTSSNNGSKLNNSNHQNTTRPASAMAGSADYWATCNPSPASSKTPPPPFMSNQQRTKTTRVRINSTSEQIQDPNWLIQMSREFELKQQSKRGGFPAHFKSLQQKLKSTIVGSSSSSSADAGVQSGAPDQITNATTTNCQQQENPASSSSAVNPPPVPITPVKMPVSILKQPGSTNRTPLKSAQNAKSHLNMGQQTEGVQARPQSRNQSTSKITKQQQPSESSNKQQQQTTTMSKQTNTIPKQQASGKKLATGNTTSETTPKQATATPAQATRPTETASAKNDLSAPNPAKKAPPVPSQQSVTTTTAQTSPLTHHPSGSQQQTAASTSRPVPICADGQVKVSGWKRNNLLAKTLSHFDEIRGNQRPIFMPTKITLPPEKRSPSPSSASAGTSSPTPPPPVLSLAVPTTSQESRRGSSSSTAKLKITTDLTASGNRFAGIVREAIRKKSLLGATHNSLGSPTKRVSQDGPLTTSSERHQSCDMGDPAAGRRSPVKRPVSADPGRSSVSSQSGGGGGQGQPKIRKQLHSESTSGAVGQQQQGAHSQQASPSHHRQQQQRDSGPRTSMAQIIAAAVAAASSDPAAGQRSSFSLPSASVAASSSRAFKLQLKNEQVLQQLRRQSNEHRESLTIDLNNNNNNSGNNNSGNLRQESSSSANEAGGGGGGGSVRLKDWKRLTNKLGLLTGRSERQAFAGAVRSSAGTPVHSSSLAANPLRLTVSNQESRRLGARSGHRGSGGGGDGSPAQTNEQQATSRSRLLVPGGHHLFDGSNRRHSSQSSDVNAAAALSSPTSARKLSSSSMVVQPVSVLSAVHSLPGGRKGSATASPPGDQPPGGLKPSSGLSQRERRKIMSRSAAASPMLMAHQDSMCLRRSSDSEACRGGVGSGSHLKVAMGGAATPISASANKRDGAASSRSSMSGASVFYGSDGSPSGGSQVQPSPSSSLAVKTRPVVVNRDDLLHLLKVTGSSVALNVVASGDDGEGADGEAVQQQAAGSNDNEQAHEARDSQETTVAIGDSDDISRHNNGDSGAQQSMGGSNAGQLDEQSRAAAAAAHQKHDLSWVVRRTSKVAVFQQKLRNKMRWHSRQKQTQELEARAEKEKKVALADQGEDDDSRCMINEADKENNPMGGSGCHEPATKDASNVLMDPTLIGDAIEMFLRTTMQQQQQLNSSEYHDRDGATAEQDQIERPFAAGKDDERARDNRTSPPPPLDGKLTQQAPPLDRSHDTTGESPQAADGTRPFGPIERVKALPPPLPPPPPPSVIKKDGELRQKQQQQQRASIGGGRGSDSSQQTSCAQLTNKRTKTQIQASTG